MAEAIWKKYGMRSILNGIGEALPSRNFYLKEETTAEQE